MSHRSLSLHRRHFLLATLCAGGALASSSRVEAEDDANGRLARGVEWLLNQQAEDGGWHSETYGALRQGAAVTAQAIYALCHVPHGLDKARIDKALARGLAFLAPGIKLRGFVACPDGSLDYPTYGTAMLATAARLRDFGMPAEQRAKFVAWVMSGQLHESREFTEKSPHYGGWDLMGASDVKGLTSDTNVSCTCFALEALVGSNNDGAKKARTRAAAWAMRCYNPHDKGFRFSPDPESINHKAGFEHEKSKAPKSYGTATCDGLRAWQMATEDHRQHSGPAPAALEYLKKEEGVDYVPGFENPDDPLGWAMGLRLYYHQTLVKAIHGVKKDWAVARRSAVLKQLAAQQHKDGRWQNESARMREDDPLIATCLALVALGTIARS
jgi:hypothetical protein